MKRRPVATGPFDVPVEVPAVLQHSHVEDWVDVARETPPEDWEGDVRWYWYQLQAGRRLQAAQDEWLVAHGVDRCDWARRRALGMNVRWPKWRDGVGASALSRSAPDRLVRIGVPEIFRETIQGSPAPPRMRAPLASKEESHG